MYVHGLCTSPKFLRAGDAILMFMLQVLWYIEGNTVGISHAVTAHVLDASCVFPPRVRTRTETPGDSTGPTSASWARRFRNARSPCWWSARRCGVGHDVCSRIAYMVACTVYQRALAASTNHEPIVFHFRFQEPGARRRTGMCKDVLARWFSPPGRYQGRLRREMRHASFIGHAPVWQNSVAEWPVRIWRELVQAPGALLMMSGPLMSIRRTIPRIQDNRSLGHGHLACHQDTVSFTPAGPTRARTIRVMHHISCFMFHAGRPTRIRGWPSRTGTYRRTVAA